MVDDAAARHTDRVAQADGAAVDVDFFWVDVQHLHVGQHHHTERFVDLPQRDVFLAKLSHKKIVKSLK